MSKANTTEITIRSLHNGVIKIYLDCLSVIKEITKDLFKKP